jgi:hypothetical protein
MVEHRCDPCGHALVVSHQRPDKFGLLLKTGDKTFREIADARLNVRLLYPATGGRVPAADSDGCGLFRIDGDRTSLLPKGRNRGDN